MIRAELEYVNKTRRKEVIEDYTDETVVLRLTRSEASVLKQILYGVGGDPHKKIDFGRAFEKWTPRGVADDISVALAGAGIKRSTFKNEGLISIWPVQSQDPYDTAE